MNDMDTMKTLQPTSYRRISQPTRLLMIGCLVYLLSHASISVAEHAKAMQLQPAPTATQNSQQPVFLQAESLDFSQREHRLLASGQVIIQQGDLRLFADRIEMDTERGTGTAWGHVRFLTPTDDVQASRLDFNLSSEQGLLYDATGVLAQVYKIEGERIALLSSDTASVRHGRLTTCTDDVPDWQFRVREATVDRDDYVSLQHPSLWIKGIPVFYLPYFYFPIQNKRATGFLPPRIGYTSNDGAKVQEDFFWAITDWMDATVGLEYLSERGFLPQIEYRYALDPRSDGRLNAAYIRDWKQDKTLWRVALQQQQELGWGVRGLTQLDWRSKRDLLRRFSNNLQQESEVSRTSFGDLTKQFSDSTLSLGAASTDSIPDSVPDDIPDSDDTQHFRRLPTLRFQQLQIPLLGIAFAALDASYSRLSSTRIAEDHPVQRLDFFPNLILPLSWAPWLRLTVAGGMHETFYDRQTGQSAATRRDLFDLQANLEGPTLQRAYATSRTGQTFIHLIETRVAYRYVPSVNQQDIPPFEVLDERRNLLDPFATMPLIDRIRAANYVKLSLVNSLFIRQHEQNTAPRVWEMARLTLSQGLDIRRTAISGAHTLGPLDVELELNTWQHWHGASFLRLDTATGDLQAASTRLAFSPYPGWALHLSHNYRQNPDVQYLIGGLNASWLQRFRTGYDFRLDARTGTLREHRMTFSILAQCWSVDMALRFRNTDDTSTFPATSFTIQLRLFHL